MNLNCEHCRNEINVLEGYIGFPFLKNNMDILVSLSVLYTLLNYKFKI